MNIRVSNRMWSQSAIFVVEDHSILMTDGGFGGGQVLEMFMFTRAWQMFTYNQLNKHFMTILAEFMFVKN